MIYNAHNTDKKTGLEFTLSLRLLKNKVLKKITVCYNYVLVFVTQA